MRLRSSFVPLLALALLAVAPLVEARASTRPHAARPLPETPAASPASPAAAPIIPLTTVHPSSYDVRLHVEPDGTALVEHALVIRIAGGYLRSLDLKANDPRSVASGEPSIIGEDGRRVRASLMVRDDGVIHLEPAEEKSWKRGAYTIRFALKTDLEKTGALKRDGVMFRIGWSSPVISDGVDGMRVVFDLPAAPTEPRAVSSGAIGGAENDDGLLSTLRRSAARDELEIVRPHVSRGEAVSWQVRVDPRALPAVRSPALAPRPLVAAVSAPAPTTPWALAFGAGALVAALAFAKERAIGRSGGRTPPRLPLPAFARLPIAGVAAAGSLLAFVDDSAVMGALLVMLTCAAIARRSITRSDQKARGPGEWLALRPSEAFAKLPASMMSLSSWGGRIAFVLALGTFAVLAWGASVLDPRVPSTFALLGAVVPALWVVDARSQVDRARWLLARAHARLATSGSSLRAVPFVRVPKGGSGFEEVRLRVLPRHPIPGLLALELGSAGEAIEIFVRVRDDSPASRRLARCAEIASCRALRTIPGRVAEERVLSLQATSPTLASACRLAADLGEALVDRREIARAEYAGPERRDGAVGSPNAPAEVAARAA